MSSFLLGFMEALTMPIDAASVKCIICIVLSKPNCLFIVYFVAYLRAFQHEPRWMSALWPCKSYLTYGKGYTSICLFLFFIFSNAVGCIISWLCVPCILVILEGYLLNPLDCSGPYVYIELFLALLATSPRQF